jgi:hypothetical protein
MLTTTGALIAAGIAAAGATAGAIGSAAKRKQARDTRSNYYDYAEDTLRSQFYRDPLTTAGNRALLKAAERNYDDNLDAINNRMIAGGATMENQLAARQANNESRDRLYGQLLMNEEARRDRNTAQRLQLAGQRATDEANSYMQDAQDWQTWGGQMANAALSYGSSSLLGGMGSGVDATGAAAAKAAGGYTFAPLAPAATRNKGLMKV